MPRRELIARPKAAYRYVTTESVRAIDLCETSVETGGLHRVEPAVWPPRKKRGVATDDAVSLSCVHCGAVCLVYPDNDPESSGIDVIVPGLAGSKK